MTRATPQKHKTPSKRGQDNAVLTQGCPLKTLLLYNNISKISITFSKIFYFPHFDYKEKDLLLYLTKIRVHLCAIQIRKTACSQELLSIRRPPLTQETSTKKRHQPDFGGWCLFDYLCVLLAKQFFLLFCKFFLCQTCFFSFLLDIVSNAIFHFYLNSCKCPQHINTPLRV